MTTSHWTQAQITAFDAARARGDTMAFYCSDAHGHPANGGVGDTLCAPGAIHTSPTAVICKVGLHATDAPQKWRGTRVWVVALCGGGQKKGDKFCATRREIIGEVLPAECLDAGVFVRIANLCGADLRDANLRWANLLGANLCGANLRWANLSCADLRDANLLGANLLGVNLRGADLSGVNLRGANLRGADLRAATLRAADLSEADLLGADLLGANLCGVIKWIDAFEDLK